LVEANNRNLQFKIGQRRFSLFIILFTVFVFFFSILTKSLIEKMDFWSMLSGSNTFLSSLLGFNYQFLLIFFHELFFQRWFFPNKCTQNSQSISQILQYVKENFVYLIESEIHKRKKYTILNIFIHFKLFLKFSEWNALLNFLINSLEKKIFFFNLLKLIIIKMHIFF
jgi:hypothetical protein